MGFTTSLRNNVLNHVFRATAMPSPTNIYVALFVGAVEVSAPSYARQSISFGAPVAGVIKNDEAISFDIATEVWGTITKGGIYDSLTGGNPLDDGVLLKSLLVDENKQFNIPIGNYTIEVN